MRRGEKTFRRVCCTAATGLFVAGCSAGAAEDPAPGPAHDTHKTHDAPAPAQLPRGGRTLFPAYRVVGYYGTAGTPALGVLGSAPPERVATDLDRAAAPFATPGRRVLPAMELVVTIADGSPGPDGDYCHSIEPAAAWQLLRVARAHHQLLLLDVQPGRHDFLSLTRQWEPLLTQPDVGLALDPEWRMPDGGVPGQQIGHVGAGEVDAVADWLAQLVRDHRLPQKLLVIHQFTGTMIEGIDQITAHPELALVQQVDGFGSRADKLAKYRELQRPDRFHLGFKLFYTQDVALLTPPEVLRLAPPPEYVSYQ